MTFLLILERFQYIRCIYEIYNLIIDLLKLALRSCDHKLLKNNNNKNFLNKE